MSTPAKRVGNLAKRSAATPDEKAPPSGKKVRTQAKTAAMWGEDDPPTDEAAAEATPSKHAAAFSKLVITPRKRKHDHIAKEDYGDEEGDGTEKPPNRKHVGEKSKKSPSKISTGENVTKSKESEIPDEEDGGIAITRPLSETTLPAKINTSFDENEKEDKETEKKPAKRKKKVAKEKKATPGTKRPKTEGTGTDYSLYLGNLNSEKEPEEIKEAITHFFTKKGLTVCGVRIGSTKKFGYADFSNAADLEKALKMNGENILGLECDLKARNKEGLAEITREREARTLFAKNLPYSTTPGDLQDVFANAVNFSLPLRKDGSARGMAYIEFESEAEADKTFKEKQGTDVKGRPVILDYTGDKSGKRLVDLRTLVVSNISKKATELSLKEVFQKAISIRIKQHNNVKQKGVALVEFSTEEDAKEALESSNKVVIEGLKVHLMLQSAQPTQTKTLFVRGLSGETTENSLREAFDGAVGCRIATDQKTGVCKGFGFVDFSTSKDASVAKKAMEGFEIDGNMVILEFAKPKAEGSRGFGGRSEEGKGGQGGDRGRGRGGKMVAKGGGDDGISIEGVKGGNTGKGTGGKKSEKGKKEIGGKGGGGKLGLVKERDESNVEFGNRRGGGERGIRGFGGRVGSSRGVAGGKSGTVGTGGGRGSSERGRGGKGAGVSKGRFGSKGQGSSRGGSARGEK